MSEIVRTGLDMVPVAAAMTAGSAVGIGAIVGASVGAAMNARIQRTLDAEQEGFNEVLGVVNKDAAAPPSRLGRLGLHNYATTLAATGALVGGLNAYAWTPQSTQEDKTEVQIVVDRSGATQYGPDANKPSQQIDSVIDALNKNGELKLTAHVAQSGEVTLKRAEEVVAVQPFGDAPMREAFKSANETITLQRSRDKVAEDDKTATVVITNGNPVGKARNIAKQTAANKNAVYIVNVNGDVQGERADNLKATSDKTGGQYWSASADKPLNPTQIAETVADKVSPKAEAKEGDSKTALKIFGLAGIALMGFMALQRRREPKTLNGTAIK